MTLNWLDKLKGDPNKRQRNRHDTSKCYDLKKQIEALIKQGKPQQFVRGRKNQLRDPELNQRTKKHRRLRLER